MIVLADILARFRISIEPGMVVETARGVSLRPKDGIRMRLTRRQV